MKKSVSLFPLVVFTALLGVEAEHHETFAVNPIGGGYNLKQFDQRLTFSASICVSN